MNLPKRYNPKTSEPDMQAAWQADGTYHFKRDSDKPVYSIDTPPPTVSGNLHLGHVYSYSHADFFARFWRMNGRNVFYPMGYDDNGLATERLVERTLGIRGSSIGRPAFIQKCLEVSVAAEKVYATLWQRLGLSIDWRYSYRTIDNDARRIAQRSFLDLYADGLVYRQKAPTIWCPECQTAIAQAELDDLERATTFHTLAFTLENGATLPIATTRPELLPACVAVFVHPEDGRFTHLIGTTAMVPHFGKQVPILADAAADPNKGTGAVMCCTFGDTTDVEWWYKHDLDLVEAVGRNGRMTHKAAEFANQTTAEARKNIIQTLHDNGLLLNQQPVQQSVRVHERCDTPVEYIVTQQWFVRVLDQKAALLEAGTKVNWHPAHMQARYTQWVENLGWDWCISRQRFFGVTFPVWYCQSCDAVITAKNDELPIDPTATEPQRPCPHCGNNSFTPETDVMDTWATSSLSPQIVGQWLTDKELYDKVMPFSLRPQAHEIIRTWAFYTIVKSRYQFDMLPWQDVAISGWGMTPAGTEKLSKSRGGGAAAPLEMIEQYSADAVRYWAASTSLGKDAVISEEKIQAGAKLVTKLWNVARFSQRFLQDYSTARQLDDLTAHLTPADRWLLARLQSVIERTTSAFKAYDYQTAKNEVESFFWHDLADNYLEMVKKRLYDNSSSDGACYTLYQALSATIKLFAPLLPHVTERIYQGLFTADEGVESIHNSAWPQVDARWVDAAAVITGTHLIDVATTVRRYKSDNNLSLSTELAGLYLTVDDAEMAASLIAATTDLISITRAKNVVINEALDDGVIVVESHGRLQIAIKATTDSSALY